MCKCRQIGDRGLWHDALNQHTTSHPNSNTYCTARASEGQLYGTYWQQELSANREPAVPRQLQGNSAHICAVK